MVFCAAKADENGSEIVEFVDPPFGSSVGERVTFGNLSGEIASPAQIEKKKILASCLPHLKTDEKGIAKYKV